MLSRLAATILSLAALVATQGGAARAMGSMPESEALCFETLLTLQNNPDLAPSVAEVEKLREAALVRAEGMAFLLQGIEDDLDLADTELDKTDLEADYVAELLTRMRLLSVELDRMERELDCWDAAIRQARLMELLKDKRQPPIVWMPPQPEPKLPADPAGWPPGEMEEAFELYLSWLRYRNAKAQDRLKPLIVAAEDIDGEALVTMMSPGLSVFIGGGGVLPLGKADLGETQEIDSDPGGFAEIGIDYRIGLTPQLDGAVGVRATWQREGLDRLDNKGMPGSLPLDGDTTAWSGMVDLRLIYSPRPDWDLYAGGGVGGAYRHLDLQSGGMSVIDDGGLVLAWKAEVGVGYRFCGDCGLAAELFLRYQGLGGLEVESPGMDLDLGPQRDLLFGIGLRYGF